MSIGYRTALFDAQQFESLQKGDILRRIRFAIPPGRHFEDALDGYDISSLRVEEDPRRPIGSIVDLLLERLPLEDADYPGLPGLLDLLGKLTERHGVLVQETGYAYLGYLNAAEVTVLRSLLEGLESTSAITKAELSAMVKILSIAEQHHMGLILSQS